MVPGLRLMEKLEKAGAITDTALILEGTNITIDQCEALAALFGRVKRQTSWMIGDLLTYTEHRWGEMYSQVADATGLSPHTLESLVWVSRAVPPQRRVASLSHAVHSVVAKLPAAEQKHWLARAKQGHWAREVLRAHMKEELGPVDTPTVGVFDVEDVVEAARVVARTARYVGENAVCRKDDMDMLRRTLGDG